MLRLLLTLGLLTGACRSSSIEAELLALDSAGPSQLREGESLVVDGAGFEAGDDGEIVLQGTYSRPGEVPREIHYSIPAHALSSTRVAGRVGEGDFARLGGRGTFAGRLSVVFAAEASGAVLRGSLDEVGIDFQARGVALAERLDEEGAAAARAVGLEFGEESLDSGLLIREVSGVAEGAGLLAGDTIVAFAGVEVHAHSDMRMPPGGEAVPLSVEREGVRGLVHLQLPGTAAPPIDVPWPALGALMFLLLLVGLPARGLGHWGWSLRDAWGSGGMFAQGLLAIAASLLVVVSPDALQAAVLVLAFAFALTRASPLHAALHAAPVVGALFYASRLVPAGGTALASWACVKDPTALALLVLGIAAAASAGEAKTQAPIRWLGRLFRASAVTALVAAFATPALIVVAPVSLALGFLTPPIRASLGRSAFLLAAVLGVAALHVAGIRLAPPVGSELALVPLALIVAFSSAWLSTRRRPLRVAFGL